MVHSWGVLPPHLTFSVQHFRDVKMLLSHFKSIVQIGHRIVLKGSNSVRRPAPSGCLSASVNPFLSPPFWGCHNQWDPVCVCGSGRWRRDHPSSCGTEQISWGSGRFEHAELSPAGGDTPTRGYCKRLAAREDAGQSRGTELIVNRIVRIEFKIKWTHWKWKQFNMVL